MRNFQKVSGYSAVSTGEDHARQAWGEMQGLHQQAWKGSFWAIESRNLTGVMKTFLAVVL